MRDLTPEEHARMRAGFFALLQEAMQDDAPKPPKWRYVWILVGVSAGLIGAVVALIVAGYITGGS